MLDCPEHGHPIDLVECIGCIKEKKSPLFLLLVLLPGMDATFDAGFHTSAELGDAAELFGITA
jgi:hypothetical protein